MTDLRFTSFDCRSGGGRRGACASESPGAAGRRPTTGRRGFSFPEILFAVAVLGIGFIMVAAIFPVAIMQTQATMEETVGTAVTRNGINYMRGGPMMNASKLPYTNDPANPVQTAPAPPNPGRAYSFYDPRIKPGTAPNNQPAPDLKPAPNALWDSIRANLIVADDPRFAFVPLYVRDGGSNFAKLIVIGVRIRTRDAFKADVDTVRSSASVCAELEPRPVKVSLFDGTATNTTDRVVIENLDAGDLQALSEGSNAVEAAVDGAYLIISNDERPDNTTATPFQNEHGQMNGRIFRLGPEMASPGANQRQFELAPGNDLATAAEELTDATAFLVGRGYADVGVNTYGGPSMAVQHYENVVPLP